MNTGFI